MSAWPSRSGDVLVTTVVRPVRAVRSRAATAASVCASTAEVGSTARSTSGSASSALAGRRRWRWPRRGCGPARRRARARPADRARRPAPRPRTGPADGLPVPVPGTADHLAQRTGEEIGLVVRDEDPPPDLRQVDLVDAYRAPGRGRFGEPAEAVDHRRGLRRPGADQRGQLPGRHFDAGLRITEHGRHPGPVRGRAPVDGIRPRVGDRGPIHPDMVSEGPSGGRAAVNMRDISSTTLATRR